MFRSAYLAATTIAISTIESQLVFQKKYLVRGEMKPFHNILDKGYRVTQHVLQNNQKTTQPKHSKDGCDFTGDEGLCISEVASDRSGNERL